MLNTVPIDLVLSENEYADIDAAAKEGREPLYFFVRKATLDAVRAVNPTVTTVTLPPMAVPGFPFFQQEAA